MYSLYEVPEIIQMGFKTYFNNLAFTTLEQDLLQQKKVGGVGTGHSHNMVQIHSGLVEQYALPQPLALGLEQAKGDAVARAQVLVGAAGEDAAGRGLDAQGRLHEGQGLRVHEAHGAAADDDALHLGGQTFCCHEERGREGWEGGGGG